MPETENKELAERLERLEIKASYQESTLDALSAAIYGQERQLERLERQLKEITSRVKELANENGPGMPHNQKPPHY